MIGLHDWKGRPASWKEGHGRVRVLRVPPSGWPRGFACLLEVSMTGPFKSRSSALFCCPRRLCTRKLHGLSFGGVDPGQVR